MTSDPFFRAETRSAEEWQAIVRKALEIAERAKRKYSKSIDHKIYQLFFGKPIEIFRSMVADHLHRVSKEETIIQLIRQHVNQNPLQDGLTLDSLMDRMMKLLDRAKTEIEQANDASPGSDRAAFPSGNVNPLNLRAADHYAADLKTSGSAELQKEMEWGIRIDDLDPVGFYLDPGQTEEIGRLGDLQTGFEALVSRLEAPVTWHELPVEIQDHKLFNQVLGRFLTRTGTPFVSPRLLLAVQHGKIFIPALVGYDKVIDRLKILDVSQGKIPFNRYVEQKMGRPEPGAEKVESFDATRDVIVMAHSAQIQVNLASYVGAFGVPQKTIILVEDDENLAFSLTNALRNAMNPSTGGSEYRFLPVVGLAKDASELMGLNPAAGVIADFNLEDMDGDVFVSGLGVNGVAAVMIFTGASLSPNKIQEIEKTGCPVFLKTQPDALAMMSEIIKNQWQLKLILMLPVPKNKRRQLGRI